MFGTILAAALAVSSLMPSRPAPNAAFDSGTIHAARCGSGGTTLVFSPGLGSGPWSWAEQITRFSKDYTVYAITLDGFDGRAYAPRPDLFAAFSSDFWTFASAQRLDKPILIGHSLGGTLALLLGETHPERLGGIVALDGLPVFPMLAQSTVEQRNAAALQLSGTIANESREQLLAYDRGYMKQIGTVRDELVDPAATRLAASDPHAVAAWSQRDLSLDLRPELSKVTTPVVELMPYAPPSPYSKEQTLAFYQMLLGGAPHANVVAIEGARHFAMLDQPAAVDEAITQFLAQLR